MKSCGECSCVLQAVLLQPHNFIFVSALSIVSLVGLKICLHAALINKQQVVIAPQSPEMAGAFKFFPEANSTLRSNRGSRFIQLSGLCFVNRVCRGLFGVAP